jgi:hypothetical protein
VFIPEHCFASKTFALVREIFSVKHRDREVPNETRTDITCKLVVVRATF